MIETEGGAFLALLDRMNLECGFLPTVDDMALAIAAAEFICKAASGDVHLTLPELAVLDAAQAFLALVDNPMDAESWDTLRGVTSMFPRGDDDNP